MACWGFDGDLTLNAGLYFISIKVSWYVQTICHITLVVGIINIFAPVFIG